MRVFKRCISVMLITVTIMVYMVVPGNSINSYAAANPGQPPVEQLVLNPIHNTPPDDVEPVIGYNQFDGYYFDLGWNMLADPSPNVAQNKFINIYMTEVTKPYRPTKSTILAQRDVSGTATSHRMGNLTS